MSDMDAKLGAFFEAGYSYDDVEGSAYSPQGKNRSLPLHGTEFALGPQVDFSHFRFQLGAHYSFHQRRLDYFSSELVQEEAPADQGLTSLPGGSAVDETVGDRSNDFSRHALGLGATLLTRNQPIQFGDSGQGLDLGITGGYMGNLNDAKAPATQRVMQDDGSMARVASPYNQSLTGTGHLQAVVDWSPDAAERFHLKLRGGVEFGGFRDLEQSGYVSGTFGVALQGQLMGLSLKRQETRPDNSISSRAHREEGRESFRPQTTEVHLLNRKKTVSVGEFDFEAPHVAQRTTLTVVGHDTEDADRQRLSDSFLGLPRFGETGYDKTWDVKLYLQSDLDQQDGFEKRKELFLILPKNQEIDLVALDSRHFIVKTERGLLIADVPTNSDDAFLGWSEVMQAVVQIDGEGLNLRSGSGLLNARWVTDPRQISTIEEAHKKQSKQDEAQLQSAHDRLMAEAEPERPSWNDYYQRVSTDFSAHIRSALQEDPDYAQNLADLIDLKGVVSLKIDLPLTSRKKADYTGMVLTARKVGDEQVLRSDLKKQAVEDLIDRAVKSFRWPEGYPSGDISDTRLATFQINDLPKAQRFQANRGRYTEFLASVANSSTKALIQMHLAQESRLYFSASIDNRQPPSILLGSRLSGLESKIGKESLQDIAQAYLSYANEAGLIDGQDPHAELKFQMQQILSRLPEVSDVPPVSVSAPEPEPEVLAAAVTDLEDQSKEAYDSSYESFIRFVGSDHELYQTIENRYKGSLVSYFVAHESRSEVQMSAKSRVIQSKIKSMDELSYEQKVLLAELIMNFTLEVQDSHDTLYDAMDSTIIELEAQEALQARQTREEARVDGLLIELDSKIAAEGGARYNIVGSSMEAAFKKYFKASAAHRTTKAEEVVDAVVDYQKLFSSDLKTHMLQVYLDVFEQETGEDYRALARALSDYQETLTPQAVLEEAPANDRERQLRAESYVQTFYSDLSQELAYALMANDAIGESLPADGRDLQFIMHLSRDRSYRIEIKQPRSFVGRSKSQVEALIATEMSHHEGLISEDFPRLYTDVAKGEIPVAFNMTFPPLAREIDFDESSEAPSMSLTPMDEQEFYDQIVETIHQDYLSGKHVFFKDGISKGIFSVRVKITPGPDGVPVASKLQINDSRVRMTDGQSGTMSLTAEENIAFLQHINQMIKDSKASISGTINPAYFQFRLEEPGVARRIRESGSRVLKRRMIDRDNDLFEAQQTAYMPLVDEAFKQALEVNPDLKWRGTVQYTVNRSGQVIAAKVFSFQTVNDPAGRGSKAMEDALESTFSSLKFPAPPSSVPGEEITLIRDYAYRFNGVRAVYTDDEVTLGQRFKFSYTGQ